MRLLLLLFLCIVVPASCGGPPPQVDIMPERTPLTADTARALLGESRGDMIFRAETQVTVHGSRGKYTRTFAVIAQDPSSLRIEGIPLFGLPDFYLASEGDETQVYLPGRDTFYRARSGKMNLLLFFDLPLSVTDAVRLLMGRAPLLPDTVEYEGYCEESRCRIIASSGEEQTEVIWMHAARGTIDTVETYASGGQLCRRASFDDFVFIEDAWYPRLITLQIEAPEQASITLRHKTISLTRGGDDKTLFMLEPPPGVTVEEMAE